MVDFAEMRLPRQNQRFLSPYQLGEARPKVEMTTSDINNDEEKIHRPNNYLKYLSAQATDLTIRLLDQTCQEPALR